MSDFLPIPPTNAIADPQTRAVLDAIAHNVRVSPSVFLAQSDASTVAAQAVVDVLGGGLPGSTTSSGAGADINQLATAISRSALFNALGERINIDLNAVTRASDEANAELNSLVQGLSTGITSINTVTSTSSSAAARALYAVNATVTNPTTGLAAAQASILALNNVSATSTSASARALHGVTASVTNPTTGLAAAQASILALNTVTADSASASARALFSVTSTVDQKNKVFFQTTAPATTTAYTLKTNDLWFDSDDGNKAYRYTGSAWAETTDTRVAAAVSGVSNEASTRSSKDDALAAAINNVWAKIGGSTAAITDSSLANVTASTAVATKWNSVVAAVTDPNTGAVNSASIVQEFDTYAGNANSTFNSSYTVRAQTSVGGQTVVGGFGLMATAGAGSAAGSTINFGVRADTFFIASTAATPALSTQLASADTTVPFIVTTTTQTVGGVTYAPGVYIKKATIADATIDTAKITDAAITSAKIGSLAVDTLKIAGNAVTVPFFAQSGVITTNSTVQTAKAITSQQSLVSGSLVMAIATGTGNVVGSFFGIAVAIYIYNVGAGTQTLIGYAGASFQNFATLTGQGSYLVPATGTYYIEAIVYRTDGPFDMTDVQVKVSAFGGKR